MIGINVYAAEIWVSPNGDDANAGTKDKPKHTLLEALRQARVLRRLNDPSITNGIFIILKDGVYLPDEPIFIRPEDSGTAISPTIIENAPNAKPVISGGAYISNWKKIWGHVPGLPKEAQGKIWEASVPRVSGVALLFRQLWVNGKKAVRARESNTDDGMSRILSLDKQKQEIWIPVPKCGLPKDAGQMEMVIHQMWAIANLRVKSITIVGDKAKLTFYQPESCIEFEHPWPAPVIDNDHKMNGNSAFYLTNSLSFLNKPGEWYEDIQTDKVYYWPRKNENMADAQTIAPSLEQLVNVTGTIERPVSYVFFKGINFGYTTWLRPSQLGHVPLQAGMYLIDAYKLKIKGTPEKKGLENQAWVGRPPAAVDLRYVNHTGFENCTFKHLASTALDYVVGTHDDLIQGNLFNDVGGTGIQIGMYSDKGFEVHLPYNPSDMREVCTNEHIINNLVADAANEDWGCLGIGAGYVKGIRIEHNEVCDVSYSGISVGWGWTKAGNAMSDNIIRANKIHHYAKHMYDVSGIYTLSAQPNSVIDSNYVDNIYKVSYAHDPQHWFYLYTDEGSSYFTVRDNWCPAEKFLKNANGPGNVWENNGPKVAASIKESAGLQSSYKYLLNDIAQVKAVKPVIIEIIAQKGTDFKFGRFGDLKDYGIEDIKQWKNRVVIYANTANPDDLKDKISKDFRGDRVVLFDNPFYNFNRKYCSNKTVSKKWDNIILTANLVKDPELQRQYLDYHATQFQKWPEVSQGFCNARFQQLLVFKNGRQLMLVISIPKGESLDKLNPLTTRNNPRVNDWNNLMKKYQEGVDGTKKGEVWVLFKDVNVKKFIE